MDTEGFQPNDKVPIFRQKDSALLNYPVLSPGFEIVTQEAMHVISMLVLSVYLFLLLIKI